MITRQPFLTAPPQDPLKGDASHAYTVCDMPSAVIASPGNAIVTAGAGARSVGRSTAAVRHALRTLASETGPRAGLRGVMRLRPLVTQAHDVLRERFEAGGTVEDYLRGRARLADSAVIGLLHIASVSTAMRGGNMVAPLAAVAVGGSGGTNWLPAPISTYSFSCPNTARPAPEAVRMQRQRASRARGVVQHEPQVPEPGNDRIARAEDRLSSALQPCVARQLGFEEPRGATAAPRLLQLFRHHAHDVLQAAASVPAQTH
jgi:hypothetical protein